ncbi:hypothetical protein OGAPHI_001781 [Ogataea philodendri]|uniref:Uncharacterized protein n=1 Tax=Ogataea philodendri TaxID=1378263 RepID=A0A9P8P9S8_9ASCO|nr:uncharacterized protein OGAPHI_001781 [Ogataea philodendri]KAH3668027.1 hypothetical protein OGAPHI_001781 [Ogataea philodendri]
MSRAARRAARGRATPKPIASFFLESEEDLDFEVEVADGEETAVDELVECAVPEEAELEEVFEDELLELECTVPTPLMVNSLESERLFIEASMFTSVSSKSSGTLPAKEWLVYGVDIWEIVGREDIGRHLGNVGRINGDSVQQHVFQRKFHVERVSCRRSDLEIRRNVRGELVGTDNKVERAISTGVSFIICSDQDETEILGRSDLGINCRCGTRESEGVFVEVAPTWERSSVERFSVIRDDLVGRARTHFKGIIGELDLERLLRFHNKSIVPELSFPTRLNESELVASEEDGIPENVSDDSSNESQSGKSSTE